MSFELNYFRFRLKHPREPETVYPTVSPEHFIWLFKSCGLELQSADAEEYNDLWDEFCNLSNDNYYQNLKYLHLELVCCTSAMVARLKYKVDRVEDEVMFPPGWLVKAEGLLYPFTSEQKMRFSPMETQLKDARDTVDEALNRLQGPGVLFEDQSKVVLPFPIDLIELSHVLVNHGLKLVSLEHDAQMELKPEERGLLKFKMTMEPSEKSVFFVYKMPVSYSSPTVIEIGEPHEPQFSFISEDSGNITQEIVMPMNEEDNGEGQNGDGDEDEFEVDPDVMEFVQETFNKLNEVLKTADDLMF